MKKNVHIVPHMHWDREWYFTAEESRILLVNNMEEIFEMLENNDDYPYYVLDGQTAIIEDYLAVKPEARSRFDALVKKGKLIIGPWYTQTDEMIVGAESIARNLLYGIKDSEEFGDYMKIGYLPDSFGQSAQMPQILNGFGIKHSMFWRGCSERKGTNKTEFNWKSDDGSEVLVQILPLGYAIGKYLLMDETLKKRMDKYLPVLDRGATTDHIILPNGHDQMPVQKDIKEVMVELKKLYPQREFFLSKFENIFAELEKNQNLDTIKGEFLDGKYMRVHRSIYSSRIDIKIYNTRIENKITNILEPLATMAHSLGFEYHHGLIEDIWKLIMKNHAHDSIGSCCSDKVHREIINRFFIAEDKVDNLINFYKRKIADSISCDIALDKVVVYNLLPEVRKRVVKTSIITKMSNFDLVNELNESIRFEVTHQEEIDPGLIDRQIVHYGNYEPFIKYDIEFVVETPSMGYTTLLVVPSKNSKVKTKKKVNEINNDYFNITVNKNGSLEVFDKSLNKQFSNVLLTESMADDGDEYDYSALAGDVEILSSDVVAKTSIISTEISNVINIKYTLKIPKDLAARKKGLRNAKVEVNLKVEVDNNSPLLKVEFEIDNQACDHRLRAYIPTDLKTDISTSDNQFGYIQRDCYDEAMDVWEKEGWDERPDSIYPFLSYVGIANDTYGASVLTNSTREFEVINEGYNTLAITLFRCVGFLGKEKMLRRPGRPSGIKLPTPDSQMIGKINLDFAVYFHKGNTVDAKVSRVAKDYLTPLTTYCKMPYNAMKLNPTGINLDYNYSLIKEINEDVTISVIKKAEKSNDLIVRFFNATNGNKEAKFEVDNKEVYAVNLNEDKLEKTDLSIDVTTNQVKTISIKM